jgi:pimeloyl-ACP methyl ester carboxylesterase
MPYVERETAKIFYDDIGQGPLVVTTHGVCENGSYWGRTGVSQRLADARENLMAVACEQMSCSELLRGARKGGGGPFLNRLHANPESERCWRWVEEILSAGNPLYYAEFLRSFYDDPDPKVKLLRGIRRPCLVLLGEHDVMFIKPSELLVRCIPRVREVVLEGLGHMTAIEDPERTGDEILSFLSGVG